MEIPWKHAVGYACQGDRGCVEGTHARAQVISISAAPRIHGDAPAGSRLSSIQWPDRVTAKFTPAPGSIATFYVSDGTGELWAARRDERHDRFSIDPAVRSDAIQLPPSRISDP